MILSSLYFYDLMVVKILVMNVSLRSVSDVEDLTVSLFLTYPTLIRTLLSRELHILYYNFIKSLSSAVSTMTNIHYGTFLSYFLSPRFGHGI